MHERKLREHYPSRIARVSAACLLLLASAALCAAQSGLKLAQIRELPGVEIGRGSNQTPATELKLYSYQVEALTLPKPVKVKIDGRKIAVGRAWRITVSGEHFRVGAMPAVLLIDDQPVSIGMENADQTSLSFLVFNSRFIRNGATLAITYDGDLLVDSREPDPDVLNTEIALPDLEGAQKHLLPEKMRIRRR